MKKIIHLIVMFCFYIKYIIFIPHYIFYRIYKANIYEDFIRWKILYEFSNLTDTKAFFKLIINCKPYRSIFYWRIGFDSRIISWLAPGTESLHILNSTNDVGNGLVIWHGDATNIKAKKIGQNCEIWQNVTIGLSKQFNEETRPIIGDNVKIFSGSIVCGNITIGNNVIIGAGTIVTNSVPSNCIVKGNPGKIIKYL